MSIIKTTLILVTAFLPFYSLAGKGKKRPEADSVLILRDFVTSISGWQKKPLQARVKIIKETSLQSPSFKRAELEGEFWLSDSLSYVQMGDMEQMVSSNQALVVNHGLRRILFFDDASAISNQLNLLASSILHDTSFSKLSTLYQVDRITTRDTNFIQLKSRQLLGQTLIPELELRVQVSSKLEPYRITSIRRQSMELDSSTLLSLQQSGYGVGEQHIHLVNGKQFLIKEDSLTVEYMFIGHETGLLPKVRLETFVIAENSGKYRGVGRCEGYVVDKQSF